MDDDEFAALERELLDALTDQDRATGRVRDLASRYRIERDRRADVPTQELGTVTPIRPVESEQMDALREEYRGWHIWREGGAWKTVYGAYGTPITAASAAELADKIREDGRRRDK